MTVEIIKTVEEPDINMDAIVIEDAPSCSLDPKIPAAYQAAAVALG